MPAFIVLLIIFTTINTMAAAKAVPVNMLTAPNTTKPGCPRQCGNLTVPYPFGFGLGSGCSMSKPYDIFCMTSYNPPKAFLPFASNSRGDAVEVLDISETRIRVRSEVASICFNSTPLSPKSSVSFSILPGAPYTISDLANRLVAVGCHDTSNFFGHYGPSIFELSGDRVSCLTNCSDRARNVSPGECNGYGCCQAAIPKGVKSYLVGLSSMDSNHTGPIEAYNPCGFSFLGEYERFRFHGAPDLNDPGFVERVVDNVPVVLEWMIVGQTCTQARKNVTDSAYAFRGNTTCVDATERGVAGHRCNCLAGYQGNPYLSPGCLDIDECEDPRNSPCSMICTNTAGNYSCSCPSGYAGDGRKDGTGCKRQFPVRKVALGVGLSTLFLLTVAAWMMFEIRKRRTMKMKEKFFQQNGGLLLNQLISPNQHDEMELVKVFTIEELQVATKNFAEERVVGKGGYGMVYKGILPNNQVVAIKRPKFVDQSQIEQFINELVILGRTRHPNIVRLLGCCLEVEVPLHVYEFISNGTLYDHIKNKDGPSWYSWSNCLRLALDSANALAYLHSIPIIHRDIKSTNILLDETYTAKISDFGASRLIPMNQTHLSTVVQGTLGYLDPEYFLSSQLTEKSDVFSFGVVLAELLTRKDPLLLGNQTEAQNHNLATYFVKSLREEKLFDILDTQIMEEATPEALVYIAKLVRKCLSVSCENRPTMKEVAMELEALINQLT